MSLRLATKRSRTEEEASGALIRRSLGGVVWFEAPRAGPREFPYREERPRGTHTDREEAYGAGAGERLRLPVASQIPWRDDACDAENDLLRRRPRESQRVLLTVFLLDERARGCLYRRCLSSTSVALIIHSSSRGRYKDA